MKILDPGVLRDLETGTPLRLNLGCGQRRMLGFYGVDVVEMPGVDIVADLNAPLAMLPDNCVAEIHTRHTLEHVDRFLALLAEMHRVCRPDARIEIIVPHFSNPYGYSDPTHVRFFGLYSFFYFADPEDQPRRKVPSFYVPERFQVSSIHIRLLKVSLFDRVVRKVVEPVINHSTGWQDWYERRLCRWIPASEIRYVIHPVKSAAGEVRQVA